MLSLIIATEPGAVNPRAVDALRREIATRRVSDLRGAEVGFRPVPAPAGRVLCPKCLGAWVQRNPGSCKECGWRSPR
jgi:hypothetical protein